MTGRLATSSAVALLCFFGGVGAVHGQGAGGPVDESLTFNLDAARPVAVPPRPWVGRVVGIPGPEGVEKAAGVGGIPTFSRNVAARGKMYRFTMVGSDPFVRNARMVVVPVMVIPVRFEFDDGSVFDPTAPGPACAGSATALNLVLQSPVFQNADYGADHGRQFEEEVRRLEFWALTGAPGAINPGYSVRVVPTVLPTIRIVTTGFPTDSAPCGRLGMIDVNSLNTLVKTKLLPQLRLQGVSARTLPLFLFTDVVMFDGDPGKCCTLGFHSALGSGQTYGVAEYDQSGAFHNHDVSTLTHGLAEWYDDPFVNNATPAWGHVGQVSGCQANLEVGDPLTGRLHTVVMPNGVTYHPQELAFFSWFFNQVPSLGFGGEYSSGGTFVAPAALCK
jgi:hypothetical protein